MVNIKEHAHSLNLFLTFAFSLWLEQKIGATQAFRTVRPSLVVYIYTGFIRNLKNV